MSIHTLEAAWLHTTTTVDLVGTLTAAATFAGVLYAPGYILGFGTGLFGFRQLTLKHRSLWALAFSFAVSPVLASLAGHLFGLPAICWLFAAISTVALILLAIDARRLNRPIHWAIPLIALGWTLFVLLSLLDIQIGHKLFYSVVLADQSYRVAFTQAVLRTGLPPANPLYFTGAPAPMHYYYFWNILCAVIAKLSHTSARQAFIASSIWAGFGLSAVVYLFTTHFFHWSAARRWIAQGLLLVTGLDLLPALGNAIIRHTFSGDIEWWSVDPIDSWIDSLLWVPHHIAAALCCLIAWLLLWTTQQSHSRPQRIALILLASIAFASAVGLSVYVAAGFAIIVLAWLILFATPLRRTLATPIIAAASVAFLLAFPFCCELCRGFIVSAATPACHFLNLCVRQTIDSGLLTSLPAFSNLQHTHPMLLDQAMRLLLLLPGMALELGLYGLVLVLCLIAKRRNLIPADPARDTALFFSVSGLLMVMFVGSSIISNNDFGYRAALLPQFFLLLLAADLLGSWWSRAERPLLATSTRRWVYAFLLIGFAGTVASSLLLRVWLPIVAAQPNHPFSDLPADAYQLQALFSDLNAQTPSNAVLAFRPIDPIIDRTDVVTPAEFYQRLIVTHAGRQLLNAERACALHFGGDPKPCATIRSATDQLYIIPTPPAAAAIAFCQNFGVHYLLIGRHDPNWPETNGWPATLPVVAEQPSFKILDCSPPVAAR